MQQYIDDDDNEKIDDPVKRISSAKAIADDLMLSMSDMVNGANLINKAFLESRMRIQEMGAAFADASPEIRKLGGNYKDVQTTIIDIGIASKRNLITTTKDVTELYAASKLLHTSVETIAEDFLKVGINTSKIGENILESIKYVQSIGGNAQIVMKDVLNNTEQLNRFQFENGVQGLTKMAAQASMLRFDMRQTFMLADKVLDPEGAVKMASAFQRLGVAVGGLGDPFQLLNQSINDPSGLQNSLINMTKQFTFFDEKTKSFKINPQGMLTIRALAEETGLSASELSKAALAASDLDKRLSSINPSIKFDNDDDRKLLANMATMEDGKYVVTLTDEKTGRTDKKDLAQVNEEEFKKLKEIQAKAPKTLEDMQRSQLSLERLMASDVHSILDKITFGIAGSNLVRSNLEGVRKVGVAASTSLREGMPSKKSVEKIVDNFEAAARDLYKSKPKSGASKEENDKFNQKLNNLNNTMTKTFADLPMKILSGVGDIANNFRDKVKGESDAELLVKGAFDAAKELVSKKEDKKIDSTPKPNKVIDPQNLIIPDFHNEKNLRYNTNTTEVKSTRTPKEDVKQSTSKIQLPTQDDITTPFTTLDASITNTSGSLAGLGVAVTDLSGDFKSSRDNIKGTQIKFPDFKTPFNNLDNSIGKTNISLTNLGMAFTEASKNVGNFKLPKINQQPTKTNDLNNKDESSAKLTSLPSIETNATPTLQNPDNFKLSSDNLTGALTTASANLTKFGIDVRRVSENINGLDLKSNPKTSIDKNLNKKDETNAKLNRKEPIQLPVETKIQQTNNSKDSDETMAALLGEKFDKLINVLSKSGNMYNDSFKSTSYIQPNKNNDYKPTATPLYAKQMGSVGNTSTNNTVKTENIFEIKFSGNIPENLNEKELNETIKTAMNKAIVALTTNQNFVNSISNTIKRNNNDVRIGEMPEANMVPTYINT